MQCIKCNAILGSEDLTNCPYCQALISTFTDDCDDENVTIYELQNKSKTIPENEYQKLNKLMKLIVENYTAKIYLEPRRLSAIISDLFPNGKIKNDIRTFINLDVTIEIYDIFAYDEILNEDYIELIQRFSTKTDTDRKTIVSMVDLLFHGLDITFTVDEKELEPKDIASEVLNSVLNKSPTNNDDDFASSILDFINNN